MTPEAVTGSPDPQQGNRIEPERGRKIKRIDVFQLIQLWVDDRRVGKIQINFFKGGISSINVEETLKTGDDVEVKADNKIARNLLRR